jgi:hypothetical protein
MKLHSINDAFMALSKCLEDYCEPEIKNLIACVHVLWLTDDAKKQEEALQYMAKIANHASNAFALKKTMGPSFNLNGTKWEDFDLEEWNPDKRILQ